MKAPTSSQLKILRLLAAGGTIAPLHGARSSQLVVNKIGVQRVTKRVMYEMMAAGWIAFNGARGCYLLTPRGQELVDVKTFVRAFTDAQRAS